MDFEKSFNRFIQFLGGVWNEKMRKRPQVYKPKFGLERLFLAWFPANIFVRQSLANVESLHDYTIAPYPGETPYHDVKDKMSGSIRMLCFWINVNLFYRSGNHILLFVRSVINYIEHHGKDLSSTHTTGPNVSLVAENKGQVLPPEDSQVNQTAEENKQRPELVSFVKVSKEDYAGLNVQDNQSWVAASGCIAW